ncbi:gametogenetin-binding protein 2-like [Halyomorpha halys]|uniref:gametogenetin-binding protein 2-like n=1 Tax=Halyomorpha halys TaxID=286706 RepID=UPI0006D51340|nr:gametogenetin-binding protein 2-like [Halyomorpha halys]XP_024219067.1 gametogenetin-binding protein 2-like [Halyomorpha halys]
MAKLVEVYRNDKQKLTRRQLPLVIDDNLTMVMDLNSMGFVYDTPTVRGKELEKFLDMYNSLTPSELRQAFEVEFKDIMSILGQTIPCVGCRRSVERLYEQLQKSGHPALEPLVISPNGNLTIKDDHFSWPHLVCTLLHGHSARLTQLVESQLRSKKSRRCILHSLDASRVRAPWKEVWDVMRPQCREEVLLIDAGALMSTLEGYLQKHRFCGDCRTKVLRAYWLLVEEPEPGREKGYVPSLYAGIKRCLPDKHIHLPPSTDYVTALVARVHPDIIGSGGERHAKTLEIAQGEVITCLGLCVYERLHRIQMRLKEEETTCQVLAAIAIDALSRKFQVSVELKRGISKLELLYKELTKEELAKQQRKEQKKLKRKKRKERKAGADSKVDDAVESTCQLHNSLSLSETSLSCLEGIETPLTQNKAEKHNGSCCCEYSQDCGYSSGNNNASSSPSSPDGSEVACCDGFCNDEGVCNRVTSNSAKPNGGEERLKLSLEQMLEETTSSDEESFIPLEDVRQFQSQVNITQKREELRRTLRQRFAELCGNTTQL